MKRFTSHSDFIDLFKNNFLLLVEKIENDGYILDNFDDNNKNSIISMIVGTKDVEKFEILVEKGMDVNAKNAQGKGVVDIIFPLLMLENSERIFAILNNDFDKFNKINDSMNKWGECFIFLKKYGVNLNVHEDSEVGQTLLTFAASISSIYLMEKLLECGVDKNEKSYAGDSAMDYALLHENKEMIELLNKY